MIKPDSMRHVNAVSQPRVPASQSHAPSPPPDQPARAHALSLSETAQAHVTSAHFAEPSAYATSPSLAKERAVALYQIPPRLLASDKHPPRLTSDPAHPEKQHDRVYVPAQ